MYYIKHNYTGLKLASEENSNGFVQVIQRSCQYWVIEQADEQFCSIMSACCFKFLTVEGDTPGYNKFQLKDVTHNCRQLFRFKEYSGKYYYSRQT